MRAARVENRSELRRAAGAGQSRGRALVEPNSTKPGSDKTTGEVVRLDRFRKK